MAEEKKKKKQQKPKPQAFEIYVGEEKISVAQSVKAQINYLSMLTPEKYIMQRQGRGGFVMDYVETNYVIGRLNATFFFNWDSEILEQIIDRDTNQIAMKIRLTARFANGNEVRKDAWGGSEIKWTKSTPKKMVDLADDLKSAESDGIKKAASMLGICWDVYSGLTGNGKKKGKVKDDTDNGFTDMTGAPDVKSEFRTIPIMINKKKVMHTKYEALDRLKKAKNQLGEELYYKILGEHGYEKSNQAPNKALPKLYDAMAIAYKEEKIKPIKETKEEPEKKAKEESIIVEPEGEESADQPLGFTAEEVEQEEEKVASEFPPAKKETEEKNPEMPLQAETMSLTGLEAALVDKYGFTPDQVISKLKEITGEDDNTKLTRKQTLDGIKYFKGAMEELDKAARK